MVESSAGAFASDDTQWTDEGLFTEDAPEGNSVPGAPDWVVAAGVSVPRHGPWSGAVFLRYIGSYPLTDGNRVRADVQTVVDAQMAYELAPGLQLRLDVSNLFDARTNDSSYYYTSRLPGESPAGVDDWHVHPGEPRSFRLSLSYRFSGLTGRPNALRAPG